MSWTRMAIADEILAAWETWTDPVNQDDYDPDSPEAFDEIDRFTAKMTEIGADGGLLRLMIGKQCFEIMIAERRICHGKELRDNG